MWRLMELRRQLNGCGETAQKLILTPWQAPSICATRDNRRPGNGR
jgi:hypothetical protein